MSTSNVAHRVNNGDVDSFKEAKWYVRHGFSVIPLCLSPPEEMKVAESQKGKRPIIPWKKYQSENPTEAELVQWFYSSDENNLGIVTGELSGIVVLDIDSEDAHAMALEKGLPETPAVKTGRGYHLYFKYKVGVRNFQKRDDLPGIDLRGEGGYVVAPPSIHYLSGERYQWVKGKDLEDLELAELPDWVLAKGPEQKKPVVELLAGVTKGNRNDSLARVVGAWVKTMGFDEVVSQALEWNEKCNPPDDEQQVMRTVKSIWEAEHAGLPEDIGPADWDEPVLFGHEVLPQMSAQLLPSYLGEYAGAVSRSIQAPEGMASMLGLSVVATALQKKIVVSPAEDDDYVEPVNVWTVVVADPSERKSPVLREMMAPVVAWEREQFEILKEAKSKADTEREVTESRIKKLRTEAGNAESAEDRAAIITAINTLKDSMPEEVKVPVVWTGNVTTERLEQLMVDNDEKMAVMTDEGGIFEVMGGLYSSGKVNLDIYMQGYSGNPTRADRASRSAHMANPLLSFGLAIQPKVLQDFSKGSKSVFRGNGLLARFLYYQAESRRGSRLYGNQQQVPSNTRSIYVAGINGLLNIPLEYDEHGNVVPKKLHLDAEAKQLWVAFHDEVERNLERGGELDAVADWAGKLPGYTLRVAGLFHAVEYGVNVRAINRETMDRAIRFMRVLIPHAKSALSASCSTGLVKDAEIVLEWIIRTESAYSGRIRPPFRRESDHRSDRNPTTIPIRIRPPFRSNPASVI